MKINLTKRTKKTQASIVSAAMDFDISHVVVRYARDYDIPLDIARIHERELKRYLILCALHPYSSYGMRGPVDNLWHTFIFYTKDYFAFCESVAGFYIHHIPEDPDEKDRLASLEDGQADLRKKKMEPYSKMLKAYQLVFGEPPHSDAWPPAWRSGAHIMGDGDGGSSCSSRCGNSCDGCGSGCNSCNGGCSGCNHCNSCHSGCDTGCGGE